jgi:hypothetical protein
VAGSARLGMAWRGKAGLGTAGMAWHGTTPGSVKGLFNPLRADPAPILQRLRLRTPGVPKLRGDPFASLPRS